MIGILKRFFGRRWVKRAVITATALMIIIVASLVFIMVPTLKRYPETSFPAARSQSERNLQDLAHLRRLPEVERSFTKETSAAFLHALDEIERRAGDLDMAAMAMGLAKAVALADNGHTNVLGLVGDYGFNAVPIRLGWFADGLFVIAAADRHSDLLGGQILAVNGRSTEDMVRALRPFVGGPPNLARELSPNLLISPDLLRAAGLAETADRGEFQIRKDGKVGSVALTAAPASRAQLDGNFWPKRNLSPVTQRDGVAGWRHVLDGVAPPPYLSRLDDHYWHDYPEKGVLYVQINRVRDKGSVSITDYLSALLDEAKDRKISSAIVDLRFNQGGNYLLTADFSRRLPALLPPDGKIFILTSANTFSAAITTAARLKYFAGQRAVLIGEAMGDRAQFWGEGGATVLPNAKIAVRYTTAYHDWENGCGLAQITTCFPPNYFYGARAGSLLPNVMISPTFAEYAAGRDIVMAEALRLSAAGRE